MERLAFNRAAGTPARTRRVDRPSPPTRPAPARRSFGEGGSLGEGGPEPARERQDWAYFGLLLFTFVVFVRPQDHVAALRAINVAEIAAAIGLGGLVLQGSAGGRPLVRVTPEVVGVIGLAAWAALTMPFSIWPGGVFAELTSMYLKVVVIFVLMVSVVTTPRRLDRLAWFITLCVGYIATRGVLDYARGANLVEGSRLAGAVGGILRNPNDLALNLVTFLPFAIFTALDPHRPRRRLVAAFLAVMMLAAIVFTKSRGGMLGLAAMLAVTVLHGRRVRPGMTAAVVLALVCAVPFLPSSFMTRMSSIFDEELDPTGSREARRELFADGFRAFLENPILGVGAGQFINYDPENRDEPWREAHNVLLEVGAELGIFGLAIFLFLLARAAGGVRAVRRLPGADLGRLGRRRGPPADAGGAEARHYALLSAAMGASLTGWFVCAMFAPVAFNWTFYYVLALCASLRDVAHERLAGAARLKPAPGTSNHSLVRSNRSPVGPNPSLVGSNPSLVGSGLSRTIVPFRSS